MYEAENFICGLVAPLIIDKVEIVGIGLFAEYTNTAHHRIKAEI